MSTFTNALKEKQSFTGIAKRVILFALAKR
jgi:hypothetical protein